MNEILRIRPYARLITMLGDQLIKDEVIALSELIKNAYDADASWVKISFIDFNEDYSLTSSSRIVIEDDGCGMDDLILRNHWLNPATPEKKLRKEKELKTQKGRILQGEKGIGRFAIFKLGKDITITSRRQLKDKDGFFIDGGEKNEYTLKYNFSKYDSQFLKEGNQDKELFLDDLEVSLSSDMPKTIIKKKIDIGVSSIERAEHGTVIEIRDLKTSWDITRIRRVQKEVGKLQPVFDSTTSDFNIWFDTGDLFVSEGVYKEKLIKCINEKPVFKITDGVFNQEDCSFNYKSNGIPYRLDFQNERISGLKFFKRYFKDSNYKTECGSFRFEFYVFDFNAGSASPSKYYLDKEEQAMIKDHRIYLYRDGLRVMPYGDPDDDWLGIDIARGTIKAGEFLSNDQVVGCVYISQKENPGLVDKTSREGLIDDGKAFFDFVSVLKVFLSYLRSKPYAQYLIDNAKKKEINDLKKGRPIEIIEKARIVFKDDPKVLSEINKIASSYNTERQVLQERITKTENLAAVGLSVETASHDLMLFLRRAIDNMDSLIREVSFGGITDNNAITNRLTMILGNMSIVKDQMKDIQLLFPSTKSKTKRIAIKDIVDKVYGLYKKSFDENGITVNFQVSSTPLIVKTTDAVLLQVFINLFDNSLYWLKTVDKKREILIKLDGSGQRLVFADNGPGVSEEDRPYIFEAFYSGKGEDGRGLGLYIARQLLDRYDYTIDLAEFEKDRILSGANFVLEFIREEQ